MCPFSHIFSSTDKITFAWKVLITHTSPKLINHVVRKHNLTTRTRGTTNWSLNYTINATPNYILQRKGNKTRLSETNSL